METIEETRKVTVTLTMDDVDDSKRDLEDWRASTYRLCPVSRACRRAGIKVDGTDRGFIRLKSGQKVELPQELSDVVRLFDDDHIDKLMAMLPITAELEVPL